jgi:hypothetical protein
MLVQVATGIACVVALGVVIRRGGPSRPWGIAGLLIFGTAWQFSMYGMDHNWAVTHHGLSVLLAGVQIAGMGLLAVGAIRRGRSKVKPTAEDSR